MNLCLPLDAHPGSLDAPSNHRLDRPRMASPPPLHSPYVVLSIARSATAEEGKSHVLTPCSHRVTRDLKCAKRTDRKSWKHIQISCPRQLQRLRKSWQRNDSTVYALSWPEIISVSLKLYKIQEAFATLNDPEKRRAYDIHVRPLPEYTPKKWDDDQSRRMKDRNEWAKKNEQRQQDRMKVFKETAEEQLHNIQQCTTTVQKNSMVDKMLQELYALNPEWEARRQKAQAVSITWAVLMLRLTREQYKFTRSQTTV